MVKRKRKSFSGTTKAEVKIKITEYISDFEKEILESDESKKTLSESMQNWLQVFKFPSVEQTTYDRAECTARNLIYPTLRDKIVGDTTSADIKKLLNDKRNVSDVGERAKDFTNSRQHIFLCLTQAYERVKC